MKRILAAFVFVSAAGCGGSDGGGSSTKNLANFQGAIWNGQITSTVTCPGAAAVSQSGAYTVAFSPGTGADLQYTSVAGCLYKFNVSGNTASLSNAPVSCTSNVNSISVTTTWTSYTLTTSDGHNLSINAAGSGTAQGQTCSFTTTGTATR